MLETNRIRLRKTISNDLDFVLGLEKLPENSQFIIPWTKEKHIESLINNDILHLVMEEKTDEIKIGYIILAGLSNPNQSIELMRITIGPKGKGYGKEAFHLVKEWCFNTFHANRLWLDVKINNHRAIHLYKRQGFIVEGTLRDCLKTNDGYESLQIMSLLRKEFVDLENTGL